MTQNVQPDKPVEDAPSPQPEPCAQVEAQRQQGQATGVIALVHTFIFGFVFSPLLDQNVSTPTLVLLALSACCSVWAITFSVLEMYYTAMVGVSELKMIGRASRVWSAGEQNNIGHRLRGLEVQLDAANTTPQFNLMRKASQNSVWVSLTTLMVSIVVETATQNGQTWTSFLIGTLFVLALISVPITILAFRNAYWPIMEAYDELVPKERSKLL